MITRIAAFAGGALIGFGAGYIAFEKSLRAKYDEMAEFNRRAYERAAESTTKLREDLSVASEAHTAKLKDIEEGVLQSVSLVPENTVPFDSGLHIVPDQDILDAESIKNDYARALDAETTSVEDFVAGTKNIYGVSYIEEEEFQEEDGRDKRYVQIIMNDTDPVFLMNGDPMDDYADALGDSILVDMFTHCPPGTPPILYVRNDRTGEDFEVERVEP